MWRIIGAIVAGLIAWAVIVTLLNFGLRAAIPGYHAAEPVMHFTLIMKIARLAIAALTSLFAGAVVGLIAPRNRLAPWICGLVVLLLFLPEHIRIWDQLPVWYHLSFLIPLIPLVAAGGWLASSRRTKV